jgi:hypothetical protein
MRARYYKAPTMLLYFVLSSEPYSSPSCGEIFSEEDKGVGELLKISIPTRANIS